MLASCVPVTGGRSAPLRGGLLLEICVGRDASVVTLLYLHPPLAVLMPVPACAGCERRARPEGSVGEEMAVLTAGFVVRKCNDCMC